MSIKILVGLWFQNIALNVRWVRGSINYQNWAFSNANQNYWNIVARTVYLNSNDSWFCANISRRAVALFLLSFPSNGRHHAHSLPASAVAPGALTCCKRTAHTIMTCIFLVAKKVSASELCAVGACSRFCSRLLNDGGRQRHSISMWSANFILGRVVWPNMHDVWCPLARSMGFCVPM